MSYVNATIVYGSVPERFQIKYFPVRSAWIYCDWCDIISAAYVHFWLLFPAYVAFSNHLHKVV